ncbi:RNA polymerase sigma factor [Patescibacteria group bacterium]|nr:RNA polymerase sigma factor [Patescibacteria group bacterium]
MNSNYASFPDHELTLMVRNGDTRAFDHLFFRHLGTVLTRLRSGINRYEIVEDLVQETFIEAFVQLTQGKFRGESKFSTWITQIAFHKGADYLKIKSSKRHLVLWKNFLGTFEKFDEELNYEQEFQYRLSLIKSSMKALAPIDRKIIDMTYLEGKSKEQVMKTLNLSDGNYRKRKSMAISKIKETLGEAKVA